MTNELGQTIVTYEYDPAGRLSRKTLGNGVFTTYTYNLAGQVTQLVNARADSNVLSSFVYTYDASGRRVSMTTQYGYPLPPGGDDQGGAFTYGYDPLGQLTSVSYPNGRVVTYAYDAAGNRTQVINNGVPTAYSANPLNQYTSVGGTDYLFDADGNLTNQFPALSPQLSTTFTYDSENRLIGVATPADTWTYAYDAFGNRIAATHNGQTTRYLIDPTGLGNVAAEYGGGGGLIARYEQGFGMLARTDTTGSPAFYTFSAIGNTSELTDPAGAVANAYSYDPFGLSLGKTETIPNSFEFVGEFGVMNEGNGLDFMRARFYKTDQGRFTQMDPIRLHDGPNPYVYAANAPISLIDPSGRIALLPALIGGLFLKLFIYEMTEGKLDPNDTLPTGPPGPPFQGSPPPNPQNYIVVTSGQTPNIPPYVPPPPGPTPGPSPSPPNPSPVFPHWTNNLPVLRSRDPNDKLGPSGYGSAGYLPAGGVVAYQIRFENQPSATAPAQRVAITDTLDPNFDLSTFELTEIAFANQTLAIPAGLNHYETRLAFAVTNQTIIPLGDVTAFALSPPPTNGILVEVDAHLDLPKRVLTLTLTSLDPLTGWYPENPLTGFLYPNDDTGRGDGSISYLVRARTNLATGATITNRADIVFDYSDPIITPLTSNTIDSAPPNSSVTSLPTEAGPAILVQWSGQDDTGGSGLASYDVWVTIDGTNSFRWLERTTATSACWRGVLGSTYAFHTVARDNVGQEESPPTVPDAVVTVPTNAPVLTDVANREADVGNMLLITNTVSGTPVGSFVFSLGNPAPFGATINPTNGILRWTPNCAQASRTHALTVVVTDTGNPNLRDIRTFTVTTRECVVPGLGRVVLLAGDSGRVPVNLISSVPLTNLSMTVETDTNRLINLWLEPVVPEICSNSIVALSNSLHSIKLNACPDTSLIGTQQVAWLYFMAKSNQSSAFVGLHLDNTVGYQADGQEIRNFAPQAGRTVVVGEEPLLEAIIATNQKPSLILYAEPGPGYTIEAKTTFDVAVPWQTIWQGEQPSLFQEIQPPDSANRMTIFRARRTGAVAAVLGASMSTPGQLNLLLRGQAGVKYQIESTTSLGPAAIWQSVWEGVLQGPQQTIPLPTTNQTQFFRAVRK